MSIERQATFWLRNVNEYKGERGALPALPDGYLAFSDLMKRLFGNYHLYETSTAPSVRTKIGIMADDLENYHNLTETVDCLYQMAAIGILREEGCVNYLEIDKSAFRKAFKGSPAFPFQVLENHDFYFRYFKNGREVPSYKSCDLFHLFNDADTQLIAAMKAMSEALPDTIVKEDYAGKKHLFSIADFACALIKRSTKQTEIDPLKLGIINTAGIRGELWREIVASFVNDMKLTTRAYINPFVFPNWTVKFLNKKKTIVTFTISPDSIHVKLPLTYDTAKNVIMMRESLPEMMRESVGTFGCCGCGKCTGQSNIELFRGVSLCRLRSMTFITEDSRSISGDITAWEEAAVMYDIAKRIVSEGWNPNPSA